MIPSSPKSVKLSGKVLLVEFWWLGAIIPTGKGISRLTYAMANKWHMVDGPNWLITDMFADNHSYFTWTAYDVYLWSTCDCVWKDSCWSLCGIKFRNSDWIFLSLFQTRRISNCVMQLDYSSVLNDKPITFFTKSAWISLLSPQLSTYLLPVSLFGPITLLIVSSSTIDKKLEMPKKN